MLLSACQKTNASSNTIYSSSDVISSTDNPSSKQQDSVTKLAVIAMNDVHGNVMDSSSGLGLSKTTTLINSLTKNKNPILLSQGDMWQGSTESNYTKGNLVTEWMNYMDFTAMTLGNHEFDWGQDVIKENVALANFPFLGINVLRNSDNQRVDYATPSVVKNIGDLKIGVIGAIGNCYSSISASLVTDIHFAIGDELTTLIKNEATRLRNEEDCDLIFYTAHGSLERDDKGKDSYDISLSKDHYVDLVLEGHTHQQYAYQDDGNVYHVQCQGNNGTINCIDIDYDLINKSYTITNVKYYRTGDYTNLADDAGALAIIDSYKEQYNWAYQKIGYNSAYRSSSYLKQLVANLYLEKGLEKWGNDYDITLGGGYLNTRSPYSLARGDVTYSDINALFPFDNEIVLCSVSGNKLDNQFVHSTNENYFIALSAYGQTIQDEIKPLDTYYLITDTYSSDYSYNGLTVIDTYKPQTYARDLLADYIKSGGLN